MTYIKVELTKSNIIKAPPITNQIFCYFSFSNIFFSLDTMTIKAFIACNGGFITSNVCILILSSLAPVMLRSCM